MALIACPHCGKQVSDKAEQCVHCGKDLRQSEDWKRNLKPYEQLNADEQSKLFRQFSQDYPEYVYPQGREKAAKKRKVASNSSTVCGIFAILILLVQLLNATGVIRFSTEGDDFILPGILISVAFVMIIVSSIVWFIFNRIAKKHMRRFLLFTKLFQTWLSKKGIQYKFVFDKGEEKFKKYFNNINPVLYLKED